MSKILIAFSGGPDSVYLYYYLKKLGHNLAICYINHNLRDDVDKDMEFVINFAKKENIKYFIKELKLNKFSENIAREKRYEELKKVQIENNYEYIATGHNKNDNVETIIFRLLRGTGLDGLKGIQKVNGSIIRPILDITKEEIVDYLHRNNIEYLIDYTNNENKYSRNIIRNKLFPIMKDINPNFIENISRFITILNEDENEIKKSIKLKLEGNNIKYNKNKIDEIYSIKDKNGASIKLNEKFMWYKSYNYFGIKEINVVNNFEYIISLNETKIINGYEIKLLEYEQLKIHLEKKEYKIYNIGYIEKLNIRNKKDGDRLENTKIKKIFIDNKIDKIERNIIPIISIENEIIAVGDIKSSSKIKMYFDCNSNYLLIRKVD